MLGVLPSAVVAVLGPRAAIGSGQRAARRLGTCLVLNVVLNLILVPRYGVIAAAWATVLCQVALMILLGSCLGDQVVGAQTNP
jgi:O-antigen/teichoic acid export membrane protein